MKEKIVGSANKFVGKMSYLLNEMAFVYPITPSSLMGEIYENMSAQEIKNIYDGVGKCVEMQSEAGVAGALHGALLSGSIATTYSSSQGLLLMIPNMYKIAGECLPCVINVATRSLATHALNIFCDHSDIYAARYTGFAMLSSNSVQEAYDFALIAQIATYKTSIPFIHFFDGFRTSHEIRNIEEIANDDIKKMLPYTKISDFKNKAMSPSKNNVFGMVQNHDTFFQNSLVREHKYEKINTYLNEIFDEFYQITGRKYRTVEYFGSKKAEEVIITFSSAAEIVEEVIEFLNYEKKDVGLIKIRSLNPLDTDEIIKLLPKTVKKIVVLERIKDFNTKTGPLYNELVASLSEEKNNIVFFSTIYGLGGKELKFDNILSIFENL
jgi:pyruvate-ferredoxin/flavodoxin oxidoreductase